MSRRAIVLVISILTALGFTAAAFFYDRYSVSEETRQLLQWLARWCASIRPLSAPPMRP